MSQELKGRLYRALKDAGVEFENHYRNYSVEDLQKSFDEMLERGAVQPLDAALPEPEPPQPASPRGIRLPPIAPRDPNEVAGQRLNTQPEDEPLRVDPETGWIWYQEEVLKPGGAQPRGRRVLQYQDSGFKEETTTVGDFTETFEVPGDQRRLSEAKITMPSYQVGIYRDPRHPFKTVTYGGNSGFDREMVEAYYGGGDMVPEDVKRIYVSNTLCYDIRTVIRNIENEYRRLQLAGKV